MPAHVVGPVENGNSDYVPLRVAVNDWLSMPFSRGMRKRHSQAISWLSLHAAEHDILEWALFTNSGQRLGQVIAGEYNIPWNLPGYELRFHIPNSKFDTTNSLIVIPRSRGITDEPANYEEPFLLLLDLNQSNAKRPHVRVGFADYSPAMPYWGLFHAITSDEQRISRLNRKRHRDREMGLDQLMRQKMLPFHLRAKLSVPVHF